MKNLIPYKDNTFDFVGNIINSSRNSKKDPTYKNRVEALKQDLEFKYINYDKQFDNNKLVELLSSNYTTQQKNDLLRLYSYQNSAIIKLKVAITTTFKNRIINTCQYCTLNEVNSFDHIVIKEEFPEFAVNPKNLFPSCTVCNSIKGINWREGGKSTLLNLYLDTLPNLQYLFAEIIIEDGIPTAFFRIENKNNIEQELFGLIQNHYSKLRLCERFRHNSNDTIIEFMNYLNSLKSPLSKMQIIESIKDSIHADKNHFGQNYWKSILKEALISNAEFCNVFL